MENQTNPEVEQVEEVEQPEYFESAFDSVVCDIFDDSNMLPTNQDFADAFGF